MSTFGQGVLHGPNFNSNITSATYTLIMKPYGRETPAGYSIAFDFHSSTKDKPEVIQLLGSLAEDISHESTERADETRFVSLKQWQDHVWQTAESVVKNKPSYRSCGVRAPSDTDALYQCEGWAVEHHEIMRKPGEALMIGIKLTQIGDMKPEEFSLTCRSNDVDPELLQQVSTTLNRTAEATSTNLHTRWRDQGRAHAADWYGRLLVNDARKVAREWAQSNRPDGADNISAQANSSFKVVIRPMIVSDAVLNLIGQTLSRASTE